MKKEKCIKLLLIIFLFVFIFQHLSNLIVFFFTVYFHINVLILSTNVQMYYFFLMALLCLHKIDNDEQNMSKSRKIQQKNNLFNFPLISGWANVHICPSALNS